MDIRQIVRELCAFHDEQEWFEFKENWFQAETLGEYVSALSNAAAFHHKKYGYFILGVNDASHEIVGTEFNQYCDYHDEPYQNYLARNLSPSINFSFQEDEIDGKRVVVLMIPAATEKEETFIKNLGLRTVEGEYNLLAQLLSDDSHIPLRVSIFSGKTKGSKLFSVREFGNNCLLYTLDELLRYGDVINVLQADEEDRVVERKEVPLFDNKAFREAVINAVLHNKWTSWNEPMISVFSDRVEILSRGTIPPAQTMEGFFLGESIPVNEKLSEIFLQLHISEK